MGPLNTAKVNLKGRCSYVCYHSFTLPAIFTFWMRVAKLKFFRNLDLRKVYQNPKKPVKARFT